MNKDQLKAWIKHYEGYSSKAYKDTNGKLTIGWGRNLDDDGISVTEAEMLLDNDMAITEKELLAESFYLNAPGNVKDALFNMCFNLGIEGLSEFKGMISAIESHDYTKAAKAALDSKWAEQVGQRAKDVALMMRGSDEG